MDRARTSGGGGGGSEERARPAPPPRGKGGNVEISRSENNGGVVEWGERGRQGDRGEESLYVELEIKKAEQKCPRTSNAGRSVNGERNRGGCGGVEFESFDWEEEGEDRQVSPVGRRVNAAKYPDGGHDRRRNGLGNESHVPLSPSPPTVTQSANVAASGGRRSVSFATDSVMGEEKRPPIVSVTDSASTAFAAKAAAPSSSGQNNVRRGGGGSGNNARHQLDSDGGSTSATSSSSDASSTASSVAESDSSTEEIHYGPGFVSRLKSRYMSVALRSTTRVSLRRTASLENFLDKDKADDHVELRRTAKNKPLAEDNKSGAGKGVYAKTSSSSASSSSRGRPPPASSRAARATTRASVSSKESMKRAQSIEVLSVNGNDPSAETTARIPRKPSTEAPPPLPPKSQPLPVDAAVSSLANDDIVIVEKSRKGSSSGGSSGAGHRKISPAQDSLAGRPSYKRRSTSVLFGLAEKELPAPDTVKETRKIFESKSGGANGRRPGPFLYARNHGNSGSSAATMTKSRSTSSLYVRSQSVDQASSAASSRKTGTSGDRKPAAVLASSKRTSSPATRKTSLQAATDSPKAAAARKPSLPAKPSSITPSPSALKSKARQETRPPQPMQRSKSSSTFPIPPLRPVSAKQQEAEVPSAKDDDPPAVKTISNDAMANIRQGGSSVSFDFKGGRPNYLPGGGGDKAVGSRQVGVIRPITRATNTTTTAEERVNNRVNSARSAKPLASEQMAPEKEVLLIDKEQLVPLPKTYKALQTAAATGAPAPPRDFTDNVTSARKDEAVLVVAKPAMIQEDCGGEESLANEAEKPPSPKLAKQPGMPKSRGAEPVPTPSPPQPVTATAEVKRVISFGDEKRVISFGDEKENGFKEDTAKTPKSQNGIAPKQATALEARENAISSPPTSSKRAASPGKAAETNGGESNKAAAANGEGSYRDSWKQRQEQQNTMVFNFSNTKRDVTHIENDGRDISRRPKSKTKDKKKMIKQAEKAKVRKAVVLNAVVMK